MRNLEINKTKHYALLYLGEEPVKDSEGYETGEVIIKYSKPIEFKAHVSSAKGSSQSEIFGTDIAYDKTFVITAKEQQRLRFDENTVFFIETTPKYTNGKPNYNYRVLKKAETINEVAFAIKKVGK